MTKELIAVLDGQLTGRVVRDGRGRISYTYDENWREAENAFPLSLSMPLPVTLGKPRPSGGDVESGSAMLYCLCMNDNQVLALENQVCVVPNGRRGPDRL
jgi:hypothetical protein